MVRFEDLWKHHPTIEGIDNPCSTNGKSNFDNQCAIKVGVALAKCGIKTSSLPGAIHCWHGHDKSEGHVIRAEELANGLDKLPVAGLGKTEKIAVGDYHNKLRSKKGIIFFKDYWRREINGKLESHRNRSGDHIDLWNGSRLTDWKTWARVRFNIVIPGVWSNLKQSKEIWFWEVKK